MKVILREDVEKLGKIGEIVDIADGYGRNYLLPRGLAVMASTKNVKELEHQKRLIQARQEKKKQESQDLSKKLKSISCTITRKAGDEDKLFGSVTARDIEDVLKEEGVVVDRRSILLEEPIKQLGVYTVSIQLHPEVTGSIKVWVVKD